MIERWSDALIERAPWALVAVLLLSVLAAAQLVNWRTLEPTIAIDPSVQDLLPAGDAERDYLARVDRIFGQTDSVMVAIYWDEVFTPEHLRVVADLSERLQALDYVTGVWSLAEAPSLTSNGDALDMGSVAGGELDAAAAAERRRAVAGNPLYADTLVGADGRAAGLVVSLAGDYEHEPGAPAVVAGIRRLTRAVAGDAGAVRLTGPPVIQAATSEALLHEFARIVPMIFGLVALFLLLAFRSLRGVVLPLAMIGVALLWVLGISAATGRSLNLITAIVPPVVLTIGLAYALHMLSAYYRRRDADEPARAALAEVALPLLMTGATTAAGFLALLLSPLAPVREFAWLAALGVGFSVVLALTFLPAMLHLIGCRDLPAPPGTKIFRAVAERLARFDVANRRVILGLGGVVMLASVIGILNIRVGSDYVAGFAPETTVRADFDRISADFGGATPLSVIVSGESSDTFAEPQALAAVDGLAEWLRQQPEVGSVTSVADYVRVLNRALRGDDADFAIPDGPGAVKQLLLFGGGDMQDALIDSGLRHARIRVRATVSDSGAISDLVARIRARLATLPEPLSGRVTGSPVLVSNAVAEIAGGQAVTIGAALLVVFLLLSALFTSPWIGALALLPNLLPVLVYFGILGFAGITLNPTTSLIACIVLGIAVDDTLYYLARFNNDARRYVSEARATVSALRAVIRPVTYTSLALVMGFLTLTTSGLENQVQFGALAALAIAAAWLTDMTFTPALASGVRIVTLWDVLRLDLGRQPQASIPLFAGLKLRQARIFALMSNIEHVGAGERVLSEDDEAREIYVVIDGELRVWVHRDGQDVELARLQRGEVIGEVGHFGLRRTANVAAVTSARLLRFSADDLERLRRRYPRTAALVFRNLNRIQASRLAEATKRLR